MNVATPQGTYFDRLIVAGECIEELGWRSNLVVDQCRELLAAFMKGDGPLGIQFLALGRGEAAWDAVPPPPPPATTQQLVDAAPAQFAVGSPQIQVDYLDAAGAVVAAVTNRIQLTATLGPGSLPIPAGQTTYPLREFGLFGALGPDELMIDYVRHPVINIAADATFERRIRLVF